MVPSATIAFLHRLLMWWWTARVSLQWRWKQCCTACRVSGSKIANICTSRRLLIVCRYLCPTLHSVPVNCVFYLYLLVCWSFNMRENYFAISLSVILTLINFADLVLFGVWVHHKKSCWKSSIIISASLPNLLSRSEKRLVFSDPDTQFPTVGDAARKALGRRPAKKFTAEKHSIFSAAPCAVWRKLTCLPNAKQKLKSTCNFKLQASYSYL